ncbi:MULTISPECIES: hypothetical protein [Streptomyces]|uniref:Uncharacterized protein n=2 Tax=Streptomyces TaxID=1883 RepID=A0ABV9IXV8_9ACTN
MDTQEDPTAQFAIYIAASNDQNGNPRRGWLLHNAPTGVPFRFVNEGYAGNEALREAGFNPDALPIVERIRVPAREYRRMRKEYAQ